MGVEARLLHWLEMEVFDAHPSVGCAEGQHDGVSPLLQFDDFGLGPLPISPWYKGALR